MAKALFHFDFALEKARSDSAFTIHLQYLSLTLIVVRSFERTSIISVSLDSVLSITMRISYII